MRPPSAVNTGVLRGRDIETYYAKGVAGSTDVTLTVEEVSAGVLEFTGALTGNISVLFPVATAEQGLSWRVTNSTTGNFTLTVKVSGQTGLAVVQTKTASVMCNGTDIVAAGNSLSSPYVNGADCKVSSHATTRFSNVKGRMAVSRRFELAWTAGQRGKPCINADMASGTEAVREVADPDFEILGTNGTSALSTFNAEGGIKMTTAGADADQMILLPHLDTNQTAWANVTWGTDQETEWECVLKTGSNITNCIIWAGLKLTNTPVIATDDHQLFFRYEDDSNTGKWVAVSSIAGTDTATDTGTAAVVSTEMHFRIAIDSLRIARMYMNGTLVFTTAALTDAIDLIPYIGVMADGAAAAKNITVCGQAIGRKYA